MAAGAARTIGDDVDIHRSEHIFETTPLFALHHLLSTSHHLFDIFPHKHTRTYPTIIPLYHHHHRRLLALPEHHHGTANNLKSEHILCLTLHYCVIASERRPGMHNF
jgi:hypothetical protein